MEQDNERFTIEELPDICARNFAMRDAISGELWLDFLLKDDANRTCLAYNKTKYPDASLPRNSTNITILEASIDAIVNPLNERIAELEATVQRQKVEIFKLESLVNEETVIDESTGDVYIDGEHRLNLIAALVKTTILSGERPQDD